MLRRWLALFLLLLQLQPAVASVFIPSHAVEALVQEVQHTAVHQVGQGHHHDDVLSFQPEEDGQAVAHVHHDAGHHSVLLPSSPALAVPSPASAHRVGFHVGHLPDPCLEGPLRPPRFSV